ncbi:unnamed protein product, partial [Linum tenue]
TNWSIHFYIYSNHDQAPSQRNPPCACRNNPHRDTHWNGGGVTCLPNLQPCHRPYCSDHGVCSHHFLIVRAGRADRLDLAIVVRSVPPAGDRGGARATGGGFITGEKETVAGEDEIQI